MVLEWLGKDDFANKNVIEASGLVAGIAYFQGIPLYDKYFTFSAAS